MQFFCDQCKTKYSIPDEKVSGKILKLRCKKCGNVIVLKDPRAAAAADSGLVNSGHRLLQDALQRSFGEELPTSDGAMFSSSPEMPEERTQIARIPDFGVSAASVPEEWYLADSRGQFGPMDLAELVARIKRGEPDHDAVVWRDGFDDWKHIDRVPELRPYAKHLPPPRRATREMFRESGAFSPGTTGTFSPGATGAFSSSPQAAVPFVSAPAPMPAVQTLRNPTMEYGAAVSHGPAAEIPMAALHQDRLRTWLVMAGLVVVVAAVAFFLGMKLMEKPSPSPEPAKQPNAAAQNVPEAPMQVAQVPREEPMREVVYVITSSPPGNPSGDENAANPPSDPGNASRGGHGSSAATARSDGSGATEAAMTAPAGAASRSSADFNAVKQRNVLEIQRCYEMTVRKGQKELVGQAIKFNIRILPAGQVESVSFDGEMPPMMRACLAGAIQKWQFPVGTRTDTFSFEMHFN